MAGRLEGKRRVGLPSLLPLGLGSLGGHTPVPHRIPLPEQDMLLLYTDGLTEARNASGDFYPLADRLAARRPTAPDGLVATVSADVRDWTHHLADDIALIAVERPAAAARC
ncbi:SpoIIE family protein phosphatase [Kitasatospora sp. NPDC059571]|uniref:SpoIIE family protein phosphatase n=1 Tax=Kitasatospora sp. NPDC059571 TaxID=3346871 RepID=UPI00368CC2F6